MENRPVASRTGSGDASDVVRRVARASDDRALPEEGRARIAIESVKPAVDYGRFSVKRILGDTVTVEADIIADGHDVLAAVLLYRKPAGPAWREVPMKLVDNDRWAASFTLDEIGRYGYTIMGWVNRFRTWQQDLSKKVQAGQDADVDYLTGAQMLEDAALAAPAPDSGRLMDMARRLAAAGDLSRSQVALGEEAGSLMARHGGRPFPTVYQPELAIDVDREKARFSTWYEMFPRSSSPRPGEHGTFRDCEARLPYIAGMGFDVLYFPPIHPISPLYRKGRNNALNAAPGDPGSPWAIGSDEGGHRAVHPALGTLEDFRRLLARARETGIEIALDLAFNCGRNHPYLKEHPEWFLWRPDGAVQYAENPPKKYQDIYPFYFETEHWRELWEEIKNVVLFWIEQGVRIFRVDNPHTKPFSFWEWLIGEVKRDYPEVIFLSEAFTRPKIMYRLAKLGFTQSYTYFTWRNTRWELAQYLTELTRTDVREFFRPNLWTNTPDILTQYLQSDGRPAFVVRLVLAATLSSSYGIYGPAFELGESQAREPGSEEYLNSEKYEIRHWDIERPGSLAPVITRINRIRRENEALQDNWSLHFHKTGNEQIICYSKRTADFSDVILVAVNLDPRYTQAGWVELALEELGVRPDAPFRVNDILNDVAYRWQGARNYVELNPHTRPAHVFRIKQ
ncbi:MAG: alpha-1,4-glucan--maltose-1-phosphate maltosyltransferase [Chloroflexi bacterium]|nr:alpha-1,4-glucan--maltose-1-phosphate maltosyltransferase [Chloroflexota bacterium]